MFDLSSDSEDERDYLREKYAKYIKSFQEFCAKQQHFEDEIPRVSVLSRQERGQFVLENYEKYLIGLFSRPKDLKMETMPDGKDELQVFSDALRIGWKLWPDCWTGLQMILDYLAEKTRTEDIVRLDVITLAVLKEIAQCTDWPHNPSCGPGMTAAQAKWVIVRYIKQCSFEEASQLPQSPVVRALAGLPFNPFTLSPIPRSTNGTTIRICDGLNCFKVETNTLKFKICGRCKKAFYCSKECQTVSWKKGGHKKACHP